MSVDVIMPALGIAQETGTVLRWLKHPGDLVVKGEPLLEIETDKATVEIEAPGSGHLADVSAVGGDTVAVGHVIGRIVAAEELVGSGSSGCQNTATGDSPTHTACGESVVRVSRRTGTGGSSPAPKRLSASPKARRLAAQRSLDLAALSGTGPGGAVLAADVLAAVPTASASRPVGETAGGTAPSKVAAPVAPATLGAVWRIMAERTTRAWTSVPHFVLFRETDASRLVAWHDNVRRRVGADVTHTDLLVKLTAAALRHHSQLNARWSEGTIIHNEAIHIGLAIAIDDGLVVPVLRDADRLSLVETCLRRRDLANRARAGRLRPEDLRDGTFTISNLGMYGVDAFAAIINVPQAAILAVGRIADRVVPVAGRPAVRSMMTLTLSCDHRVVDGARAAKFLGTLADLIEEPAALVD